MDCTRRATKNLNWTISIPERQDITDRRSDDSDEDSKTKSYSKIVQVTDIHVDPYYTSGMNADCGEPLCCRPSDGIATSPEKAAGVWGDYRNCDTPVATLRHALKHISETHPNVNFFLMNFNFHITYCLINLLNARFCTGCGRETFRRMIFGM
jgi:hypothetical protein